MFTSAEGSELDEQHCKEKICKTAASILMLVPTNEEKRTAHQYREHEKKLNGANDHASS